MRLPFALFIGQFRANGRRSPPFSREMHPWFHKLFFLFLPFFISSISVIIIALPSRSLLTTTMPPGITTTAMHDMNTPSIHGSLFLSRATA